MGTSIKVGNKMVDLKFNFGTVYKVNKELSTRDENNNSLVDGVGNLFSGLTDYNMTSLVSLVRVLGSTDNKNKLTEDDAALAIDAHFGDDVTEADINAFFDELIDEGLKSGFFLKAIRDYHKYLGRLVGEFKNQVARMEKKKKPTSKEALEEYETKLNEMETYVKLTEEAQTKIGGYLS